MTNDQIKRLLENIPQDLKDDQALLDAKDHFAKADAQTLIQSAVATAGAHILIHALPQVRKELNRLSKVIGVDLPDGDVIYVGALRAAFAALALFLRDNDPELAPILIQALVVGDAVSEEVKQTFIRAVSGNNDSFTTNDCHIFRIRTNEDDKE